MSIDQLSKDLWRQVWEFLDENSIKQATRTCKLFRDITPIFAQAQFEKIKLAYHIVKTANEMSFKQIVQECFPLEEDLNEINLFRTIQKTVSRALETTRSLFSEDAFAQIRKNNETLYHVYFGYPLELQKLEEAFEESKYQGGPYTVLDFIFRFRFQALLDETWKIKDPVQLRQEIQDLIDTSLDLFEELFEDECSDILKDTERSQYRKFFQCLACLQSFSDFHEKLNECLSEEILRDEGPNFTKLSTIYRICPSVVKILLRPAIKNSWYSFFRLLLTSEDIAKYAFDEETIKAMKSSSAPSIKEYGENRALLKSKQSQLSCTPDRFWNAIPVQLSPCFLFRPNIAVFFNLEEYLNSEWKPKNLAFCCREVLKKSNSALNLMRKLFSDRLSDRLLSSDDFLYVKFFKCLNFLSKHHYEFFENKMNSTFAHRYVESDLGIVEDPTLEALEALLLTRIIRSIHVRKLALKAIQNGNHLLFECIFKSKALSLDVIFSLLSEMEKSPSKYIRKFSKHFFPKEIKDIFEIRRGDLWEIFKHSIDNRLLDVLCFLVKYETQDSGLQRYFRHLETLNSSRGSQHIVSTMISALTFHYIEADIPGYINMTCPRWTTFVNRLDLRVA